MAVTLLVAVGAARAATLNATFNAAGDVPVTAASYMASGNSVNFTLNFAPAVGTELTVVRATGMDFIAGSFDNLAHGQGVALSYGGTVYYFVANYFGGTGNDLVLVWANTSSFGWGQNANGQLGDNTTTQRNLPVRVTATGVLAGKTVVAHAIGQTHSLALCSDGTLAAWGQNTYGQLGDGTTTQRNVPVAVTKAGTPLAGKTVAAIATGTYHSMALCSDGTLVAWGYNNSGQLGDETLVNRLLPVAVKTVGTALAGRTVVGIAAGYLHSLALCSDGRVAAWGYNANGQLGDTTGALSAVPVLVALNGVLFNRPVVAISTNVNHALALCADGTLAAWGYNFAGQIGDNSTTSRYSPVAVTIAGTALANKTVVAIATGEHHSLALCSDGTLAAWGLNTSGQLGDATLTERHLAVAVATTGTPLATRTVGSIAAGTSHSLAWCTDGTLAAWGKNTSGQLGDNSVTQRSVPLAVNTSSLAAGERIIRGVSGSYADHGMALVASSAPPPPTVTTLGATAVFASSATLNGTVYAYGSSTAASFDYGTSSDYGTNAAATPTPVSGNSLTTVSNTLTGLTPNTTYHYRVKGVSSAGSTAGADLTFATLSSDANLVSLAPSSGTLSPAFASGTTSYTASVNTSHMTFTPVSADANATLQVRVNNGSYATVSSGSATATLLLNVGVNPVDFRVTSSDATVVRTYTVVVTRAAPVPVVYTYHAAGDVAVTAGSYEATDNSVALALAFAPDPGTELTVVKNTGLGFIDGVFSNIAQGQAVALDFGGITYHFVANYYGGSGNDLVLVWAATRVYAWGQNSSGQLGDNSVTQRLLPVRTLGALAGKTVLNLAGGANHSLALCSDGTLVAWGRNYEGQLGDSSGIEQDTPLVVPTAGTPLEGKSLIALAAGASHSLVLCSDGTLVAWGFNYYGQLGDDTTTQRNVPVAVVTAGTPLAGKTVVAITAGSYHSAALCSDGTVATWGWNQQGQLGDNTYTQRNKPSAILTVTGRIDTV
ncbi:MAG: cadherin-like beta sandwich domain-containing protein [Verrucomicrobiota bacterium]